MRDENRERIDSAVLQIFRRLKYAVFPLDVAAVVRHLPECRLVGYEKLAEERGISYEEVVREFGNAGTCTEYNPETGMYLIAVNTSERYGASMARQRWMAAHELGHMEAEHFLLLDAAGERAARSTELRGWDDEANYFAASLLAPIPAVRRMRAKCPADIRDWFGLSQTAAEYRWADLKREKVDEELADYFWCFPPRSRVKAWQRTHPKVDIWMDAGERG